MRGESGYYHPVDVALTDGRRTVYVDIVAESPSAASKVLSSIAKRSDLRSEHIVMVPKSLEASLKDLAGGSVLTYESASDVSEKLKRALEEGRAQGGGAREKR